ncbi:hypothetical protein GQ44DRAFT_778137 [Phaeosphaeriaceae sp. PMI808]|nr:hypothetical protein GQ44DRAFT_778137 [Phaeosphaeriaceae sp. PMI808]
MLDMFFGGISKKAFLDRNLIPANDNDRFYNSKCIICWGEYETVHPAVRTLPCNHVFGHGCVIDMANRPNGKRCPLCQTEWYRFPAHVIASRLIVDGYEFCFAWGLYILYILLLLYSMILCFNLEQPAYVYAIRAFLLGENYFYILELLLSHTDIMVRNPEVSLVPALFYLPVYNVAVRLLVVPFGVQDGMMYRLCVTEIYTIAWTYFIGFGPFYHHEDSYFFGITMIVALPLWACLTFVLFLR